MEENRKLIYDRILIGAAFAFYFLVSCYKLTNAPLWYDETVEYWYSKVMVGNLPFGGAGSGANMYERIIGTFQPPLYNFLMYFWLLISDGEWWFRFFGVVMGFIANLGIYKSAKKISNVYVASISVFLSSCIYMLVYYWQECSEYCLLLANMCWATYYFISIIEKQSTKNIIMFTIFAVLSVYSQYGAVFIILPMLFLIYIYIIAKKEKRSILKISLSYIIAFVFAAIPLIYFFLLKQMKLQNGGEFKVNTLSFDGNIFKDFMDNLIGVVNWSVFSILDYRVSIVFTVLFIFVMLIVAIYTKKTYIKMLAILNVSAWIFYYFAVKIGAYAYGTFGNRYNLFLLPLWIITFICLIVEVYNILKEKCVGRFKGIKYYYIGAGICIVICFMFLNWSMKLENNWEKQDMRGAVSKWYECGAQDKNTIVHYAGTTGFAYYVRQSDAYSEEKEDNIEFMPWYAYCAEEVYVQYINDIYGEVWPEEVYIIASHIYGDIESIASAFTNRGYTKEYMHTSNAMLIKLVKVETTE